MAKYSVTIEELASYEIVVEADSEDEACQEAEAKFLNDPDFNAFACTVHSRDVEALKI